MAAERIERVTVDDGAQLAVHDLGGVGEEVLFAHATMFSGPTWVPVTRRLTGVHAWAPDLRAHGGSPVTLGADVRWARVGLDLLAVVDRLGLHGGRAVGHSMGACSLLLAELARPGTFSSLWLYDPVVRPHAAALVGDDPLAEGARRRRSGFASHQAAIEHFAAKAPLQVLDPEALASYVQHGFAAQPDGTVALRLSGEQEALVYEGGRDNGVYERLGEIRCPVVVADGTPEPGRSSLYPTDVVQLLPHAREVVLAHLGHFGPLQDPAAIAASIQHWLAEGR